jgi:biopolymer transport protein ExbD
MASKSSFDQDEVISEINVVPLVDIILVVLIIFMVTAPMIMKPSIQVNLPKASSGEKSIPTQLNITLTVDGKIILNGQIATEDNVKEKSIQELAKDAEVQAVISADKDVPHGKVVSIIDVVKTAGVKKFAITIEQAK